MLTAKNIITSALAILAISQLFSGEIANAQVSQKPTARPVIEKLAAAPQDFPVSSYDRNLIGTTIYQRNAAVSAQSVSALTRTKDDPATAFDWYLTQLKSGGWSVTTPGAKNTPQAQLEGKLFMLKASHGRAEVMVCCTKLNTPYTTITVTASQN